MTPADEPQTLASERRAPARASAHESPASATDPTASRRCEPGKVYLVGAGPGAADLITVRGMRLLESADVVVHDALVDPELYVHLAAERIDVGKRSGDHTLPQDEISEILIRLARAGRRVVRLKGGDPFVLGRGSEEALALCEAGVPCEVVPGVSSALAVPALGGIPVTHRGVADAFCVVSGHPRDLDDAFTLPRHRARLTVVVLMGVRTAGRWAGELLARGWPGDTPLAFVVWGGRPEQRVVRTALGEVAGRSAEDLQSLGVAAPAVAVIGAVAALSAAIRSPAGQAIPPAAPITTSAAPESKP